MIASWTWRPENGIKTIIAEMITAAPEWAYRVHNAARLETRDGQRLGSSMSGSCVTGGFPGLCLDDADYRAAAERFLRALVTRYRDHPGLGGYDVWNECNYREDVCYCPATAVAFREWLRRKYGDLHALGAAWHRPSYADWEDVVPPRGFGAYPDMLDWLEFRLDNAYRWMRWRVDLIHSLDAVHPVVAHGIAASLTRMVASGADDWRAAAEVSGYGYTWGSSRHGDEPWKQFHAVDLVRAASRGKPFWHAEAYAGPLWMQPQVIGKPRDEGRIALARGHPVLGPREHDVRRAGPDVPSLAAAAGWSAVRRFRRLWHGRFAHAALRDGRRHRAVGGRPRAGPRYWRARPIRGDVGIIFVPETQLFTYAQQASADHYARSMQGAYQAFFDANVQADWVHVDDIRSYDLLYLPYPVMMSQESADHLRERVAAGATLICEGCPGYFGDRGHVGTVQPNLGLDTLFGARESDVEFTPDLLGDIEYTVQGHRVRGGLFMQAYDLAGGQAVGWYDDGRIAAVEHRYGEGRTLLIGSMAGAGYAAHPAAAPQAFFTGLLDWAGVTQSVWCSDLRIKARVQEGDDGVFLWVANPTHSDLPVRLRLGSPWNELSLGEALWGASADKQGDVIGLLAGARNVAVIPLCR